MGRSNRRRVRCAGRKASVMSNDYREHASTVMGRIGCRPDETDPASGSVAVTEALSVGGVVRPSVLMLLADMVVGMRLDPLFDEWTYTTDFSIRMTGRPTPPGASVRAVSKVLRHGRRLLIEEVDYVDDRGERIAYAQITFMRQPLRPGEVKPELDDIKRGMMSDTVPPLVTPLVDAAGIEVVDAVAGAVSMVARDDLRRSGGFVQGAMMSLLGEVSAQALAEAHHGHAAVVSEMDIRYLIGGRTGPLVADAEWVGTPGSGRIMVTLLDRGHDDVVTTTFLARAAVTLSLIHI